MSAPPPAVSHWASRPPSVMLSDVTTPQDLDDRFRETLAALPAAERRRDPADPVTDDAPLTGAQVLDLFDAQVTSRQLDLAGRWLRSFGEGFYTIGSAGHEGNAGGRRRAASHRSGVAALPIGRLLLPPCRPGRRQSRRRPPRADADRARAAADRRVPSPTLTSAPLPGARLRPIPKPPPMASRPATPSRAPPAAVRTGAVRARTDCGNRGRRRVRGIRRRGPGRAARDGRVQP